MMEYMVPRQRLNKEEHFTLFLICLLSAEIGLFPRLSLLFFSFFFFFWKLSRTPFFLWNYFKEWGVPC
jgi:hypothetical protein